MRKLESMKFRYTCVNCPDLEELRYIDDHEIEISWNTFRKYIDMNWMNKWMQETGYGEHLKIWKDWSVTFGRSRLSDGRRVYIMYWSAIHHVFYQDPIV